MSLTCSNSRRFDGAGWFRETKSSLKYAKWPSDFSAAFICFRFSANLACDPVASGVGPQTSTCNLRSAASLSAITSRWRAKSTSLRRGPPAGFRINGFRWAFPQVPQIGYLGDKSSRNSNVPAALVSFAQYEHFKSYARKNRPPWCLRPQLPTPLCIRSTI